MSKNEIILSRRDFWKLPGEIVGIALTVVNDKSTKAKASADILCQPNFWNLPPQAIESAMNASVDTMLKKRSANDILTKADLMTLNHVIVNIALNTTDNTDLKKEASKEILSFIDISPMHYMVIISAMSEVIDIDLKEEVAKKILQSPYWRKFSFAIFSSLSVYRERDASNLPDYVVTVVREIIKEYSDSTYKGGYFRYLNLIGIPFHSIPEWDEACLWEINRWQSRNRDIVANIILACRFKPQLIRTLCSTILANWKQEIIEQIWLNNSHEIFYEHVRLSFGHPDLRQQAIQIAKNMQEEEVIFPGTLPADLIATVHEITYELKFPDWGDKDKLSTGLI